MFNFWKKNNECDTVKFIPLSKIDPNPNQPRKYFDEKALKDLSDSIARYGVIQPITVRKTIGGYELISGERRYRAAELCGLYEIPAYVVCVSREKSAIMSLLENLQRKDLSFFEVAESYRKLLRNRDFTQSELAECIGESRAAVADKLKLLNLSPLVKKLIRDYNLSERHARALLALKSEDEQIEVIKAICREHLNVSQTEELIKIMQNEYKKDNNLHIASVKDIKVFKNTVNQALNIMKQGGIEAHMEETSHDWGTQYVIRIKNLH